MPRYIDADALVAELQKKPIQDGHFIHTRDVSDAIFNAPTLSTDEVRGVGEWERINYPVGHDYKCLACGKLNDRASNYCPDCGKPMRMKGAESEHTMDELRRRYRRCVMRLSNHATIAF